MNQVCTFILLLAVTPVTVSAQFSGIAPVTEQRPSASIDGALLNQLLTAKSEELTFHPDDVISVQVYGVKDFAIAQRVAQDGSIAFPLIGKVYMAGLSVQKAERLLEELLSQNKMIRDPQVTITVVSQPWAVVTVSGDVAKPGVFPAYANMTVMDYISEAGGLNETLLSNSIINTPASSMLTLIRPSLHAAVSIPLGPDAMNSPYGRIPLMPGDELRVGKVGVVYAVGALKNQGAYPLKSSGPTTVLQLVALAGGIGFEADKSDARIVRTVGESKMMLTVNIAKILKGNVADLALQPDDILFVPSNNLKAAVKGGGTGLIVSLASAYLYRY